MDTAVQGTEVAEPRDGLALKFVGPDTIEGLAIPFGTADSRDLDREFFTPSTDLCIEWFGKSGRPLLYDHGLDDSMGQTVIGRQTDFEIRAEGIWAQSQLDRNVRYRKAVDKLIKAGALGYSSGAMPHLAMVKDGEIKRWPWVELTTTPIPAHPGAFVHYVKSADAIRHLEAVDVAIPDALKAALTALDEWATDRDPDALPDGAKFVDLLDRLSVDGVPWVRARKDWYGKSGRVLSAATRERLMAHPGTLRQLADDLDELLAAADAPKETAKAVDLWALAIETELAVARLLGVPIEQGATS